MTKRVFSVVVLHYKQLDYWRTALDSVLGQEYPAIQLVFSDDATPGFDGSEVEAYVKANNRGNVISCSVVVQDENRGTTHSLNAADALCTGDYVTRFSADDALADPCVLSDYATALDSLEDGALGVFGHVIGCDEALEPSEIRQKSMVQPEECARMGEMSGIQLFRHMVLSGGNRIAPGAAAYNRLVLNGVLPMDERYKLIEDWPFSLRTAREGWKMQYLDKPTLLYRFGGISTSMEANDLRAAYLADLVAVYENEIFPHLKAFDEGEVATIVARYLGIARPNDSIRKVMGETVERVLSDNALACTVIGRLSASVQELSEWARILEGVKDSAEVRANVADSALAEANLRMQELGQLNTAAESRIRELESALLQSEQQACTEKERAISTEKKLEHLRQSTTWRVGRAVTWLPRGIKQLISKRQ